MASKPLRVAGTLLLKLLGLFVILEPIWMLLPFAGFLYGSVLHIQTLSQDPSTAWLTHFIFPILTLGPLGPIMVLLGLVLFCVGAIQIYAAKLRKTGLVTTGLYRFVRHPQYIALTLFGVGILLTWGRAITFLAFFFMMLLYYFLAKSEERTCIRLFGDDYRRYRERTSFLFPGDLRLRRLGARLPGIGLPAPIRAVGVILIATGLCFGLMWLIDAVKTGVREVPYLTAEIDYAPLVSSGHNATRPTNLASGRVGGIPFVKDGRILVVRGPWRNAAAPGFAERLARRLPFSRSLKGFFSFLDEENGDVAIVFCAPYTAHETRGDPGRPRGEAEPGRRGPPPDPDGPDKVRVVIMRCTLSAGIPLEKVFADRSKRTIRGAVIAPVDLARPENEDLVDGPLVTPGPRFPGEDRWTSFLEQLAARGDGGPRDVETAIVPDPTWTSTLVMVKAPILKTRLDPAFAREIFARLKSSWQFRQHLRGTGAGGRVVLVAFPRPGPNWYQTHDDEPQVSVFVVLARMASAEAPLDSLFLPGERTLLGAFTVELDFAISASWHSVGEITTIGPRRNLEERWAFFLSGL